MSYPPSAQFIYITLVLPSLFGLTLVTEGIFKILHDETAGLFYVFLGFLFLGLSFLVYYVSFPKMSI